MHKTRGFTLVELVVVILIIGILAGVAAPKLFDVSARASDNGLRQTLAVVRDAIAMYAADNGGNWPPSTSAADFRNALVPYLSGGFPKCPVGPTAGDTANELEVKFGTATSFSPPSSTPWYFNTNTGHFFANVNGVVKSDSSVRYDEL